jgi:arylsulfatase A-like enzyme
VHYFDVHDPYEPPAPYDGRFAPRAPGLLPKREAAYDGEIAFVDDQIRRLVDAVDAAGAGRNTLLVVTADHGEGLGQHTVDGEPDLYHGQTLFT